MTTVSVELTYLVCGTCGCPHMIPTEIYETAKREGKFWTCPNGHSRGWSVDGAIEILEKKLALAVDARHRAETHITDHMVRARLLERQLSAQKGATTGAKKRPPK